MTERVGTPLSRMLEGLVFNPPERQVYQPSKWETGLRDLMNQEPETVLTGLEQLARTLPFVNGDERMVSVWTGKRKALLKGSKTVVELEVNLGKARLILDGLNTPKLMGRYRETGNEWQGSAMTECFNNPHLSEDLKDRLILEMKLNGLERCLVLEATILTKGEEGKNWRELEEQSWKQLLKKVPTAETFAYLLCQLEPEERFYRSGSKPAIFRSGALKVQERKEKGEEDERTRENDGRVRLKKGVNYLMIIRDGPGKSEQPEEQLPPVFTDVDKSRKPWYQNKKPTTHGRKQGRPWRRRSMRP